MKLSKQVTDEAILRELGGRLAAARLARNLTQATLAEEAGGSKRTGERLESGEGAARLSGRGRVCRAPPRPAGASTIPRPPPAAPSTACRACWPTHSRIASATR